MFSDSSLSPGSKKVGMLATEIFFMSQRAVMNIVGNSVCKIAAMPNTKGIIWVKKEYVLFDFLLALAVWR